MVSTTGIEARADMRCGTSSEAIHVSFNDRTVIGSTKTGMPDAANREIVVITDGEPTAHFEDGQVEFSYPPTRRTIQETLREVVRCTKEGITINTFMLERTPALTDFVGLVTELNRGRAFYAEPERLGEYVLVDFVQRRTRRVS